MENNLNELKKVPTELLEEIEISESEFFEKTTGSDVNEENNIAESIENIEENGIESPASEPTGMADLLDEDLLAGLYEILIVSASGFALNFLECEFSSKELELSAKEKKVIKPLVKKVASEFMPNMNNPLEALLLATAMIVGGRIMMNMGNKKPKKEKAPTSQNKTIPATGRKKPVSKYMMKKYGENGKINSK